MVISLCSILCSCTDFKRSDQLGEIEVLLNSLQESKELYGSSNFEEIPAVLSEMDLLQNAIRDSYYDDTLDLKIAEDLDEYKLASMKLKSVFEKDSLISIQIKDEIHQLENLKMDITNSTGDRVNYDRNITFEKKKVKEIETFVKDCVKAKNEGMETFHNLHTNLQLFAIKLELKNKEQ